MKQLFFIGLILFSLTIHINAQDIPEMDFKELKPLLNKNNDTTYVVNFWATWCKPCVEELPDFLKVASELKSDKVKFIFVSLDFSSKKESRLIPYVKSKNINEQVILLNDPNTNYWINEVNSDWSGAIPATLIYKGSNKTFTEGSLSYDKLNKIIKNK